MIFVQYLLISSTESRSYLFFTSMKMFVLLPPYLFMHSLLSLPAPHLSAEMTIKGWSSCAAGTAVSLLEAQLQRGELTGLEPLTSCAFRQLMLQMELCGGPTPALSNWSAAESFSAKGKRARRILKIRLELAFILGPYCYVSYCHFFFFFYFHTWTAL